MSATPAVQLDLLEGYPIKDDPSFRLERKGMIYPFASLGRKPLFDAKEDRWEENGVELYIRNSPGEYGRPTMHDMDILAYVETQIVKAMNRDEPVSPRVRFHVHDFLLFARRGTSGKDYSGFAQSLRRLQSSTVFTNITSADAVEDGGFSWIQTHRITKRRTQSGKDAMASCEIVLCDWLFNAITTEGGVLAMPPSYFDLDSGLERKLFQIIRASIGKFSSWRIGMDRLEVKSGYASGKSNFLYDIKSLIRSQPFSDWHLVLSPDGKTPPVNQIDLKTITARKPAFLWAIRRGPICSLT